MKKKMFIILTTTLLFLSCGNKSREMEPIIYDCQPAVEQAEYDTISANITNDSPKAEGKTYIPASSSSSSNSHISNSYDNMRGFDPASEDDMGDNGMSRYIENNDEEGWD
ncbi:MAG: hypothetical protein II886_13305 [Prevotella sp.]|nr:hypothetical protein [Prevotella sp.]